MIKKYLLPTLGLFAYASLAHAQISTTFTASTTDSTLRNMAIITLDYVIDGAGVVSLDASTSNGNAAVKDIANLWDNAAAGTVSDASLFNTSFTLVGTSTGAGNGGGNYISSTFNNNGLGILNGAGQSNSRIDGSGTEEITWSYTGTGILQFTGIDYEDRLANGASKWRLGVGVAGTTNGTVTQIKDGIVGSGTVAVDGTIDIGSEGYILTSGQSFSIASVLNTPTAVNSAGAQLLGLGFTVTAVPEPSSYALLGGCFALAFVMMRRRAVR
jgi:hypothetical protein